MHFLHALYFVCSFYGVDAGTGDGTGHEWTRHGGEGPKMEGL